MTQSGAPLSDLFPRVNAERVRKVLKHDDFDPILALMELRGKLRGKDQRICDRLWTTVYDATREKMLRAGFTELELAAAHAVKSGAVVLP